jgi:hypothetical protein
MAGVRRGGAGLALLGVCILLTLILGPEPAAGARIKREDGRNNGCECKEDAEGTVECCKANPTWEFGKYGWIQCNNMLEADTSGFKSCCEKEKASGSAQCDSIQD